MPLRFGTEMEQMVGNFGIRDRLIHSEIFPWVPFHEAGFCFYKPLRCNFAGGEWIYLFRMKGQGVLDRHRHTGGAVFGLTMQGSWKYIERDWIAEPGTFVYEPPGDIHTFQTVSEEDVVALFLVQGCLQYMDEEGSVIGQDDVFTIYKRYETYCLENQHEICRDLIY